MQKNILFCMYSINCHNICVKSKYFSELLVMEHFDNNDKSVTKKQS